MPWKTAQKRTKIKKKLRLGILTLVLILGLLIVGQMVRVGHTLLSPLNSSELKRTYHWDGNFNLNLVALTKPVSVLSYNPMDGSIKILEVPDEAYIEIPGGFGSWRVGAIYKLGEAESPPKGVVLLKNSMANFLNLPIDGFLEGNGENTQNLIQRLRGNPLQFLANLPNLRTDLTPLELARFYFGVRGVRFDKITDFNLSDLGLLTRSSLADGTEILVADSSKIDSLIAKNFTEGKIVEEGATIGVFNATEKSGLAGKSSELISHLGGNVIIQTSLESKLDQTKVAGDPKYPYTTKRLKQIFCPCDILGASASASDFSRASVNLILGSK